MRIDGYEVNNGHVIAVFITDKKRNIKEHKYVPARPRGEWKDYSDEGYVECPFCECATTCDDNIEELHFCFYCGAELIGGKRNE